MTHRITATLFALLLLAACGGEDTTTEEVTETSPAASPPTAITDVADEPEPAQAAPAPAAPAADGEVTTVAALRTAFAADQGTWIGREVTVTGLFFSATSVSGSLNNISMLGSREDDMMSTVVCGFGDDAPASVDLTQYDEVRVRGTVRERFRRPALEDCSIVE